MIKKFSGLAIAIIMLSALCTSLVYAAPMKNFAINYDYDTTGTDLDYSKNGNGVRMYGSYALPIMERKYLDEEHGNVLSVTGVIRSDFGGNALGYDVTRSMGGRISAGEELIYEFDFCSEKGGASFAMAGSNSGSIGLFTPFYIPVGEPGKKVKVQGYRQARYNLTKDDAWNNYGIEYTIGEWAHVKMVCSDWTSDGLLKITVSLTDAAGQTSTGSMNMVYHGYNSDASKIFDSLYSIAYKCFKDYTTYYDNMEIYTLIPSPEVLECTLIKYDGSKEEQPENASAMISRIDIKFNMEMNVDSLEGISLLLDDEPIEFGGSYDDETFTYSIKLKDVLKADGNYKLIVPASIKNKYDLEAEEEFSQSIAVGSQSEIYILSAVIKDGENELNKENISDESDFCMEVEYVKSGTDKIDFIASCCTYNKFGGSEHNLMSGMEYAKISAAESGIFKKSIPITAEMAEKIIDSDTVKIFTFDGGSLKRYLSKNYN